MTREEIKNLVIQSIKKHVTDLDNGLTTNIQMGRFYNELEQKVTISQMPQNQVIEHYQVIREVIQELINNNMIFPGTAGNHGSTYPWLTVTEYGKKCLREDNELPYDPEGYIQALQQQIPDLDEVTLAYVSEAITSYNKRCLLASIITLGVASENLILNLIDSFALSIQDTTKKQAFLKKIQDKNITKKYKVFIDEINQYRNALPTKMRTDITTILDGTFNLIRINRNDAGHPTERRFNEKIVYANLQIFAEYAKFIHSLMSHLNANPL